MQVTVTCPKCCGFKSAHVRDGATVTIHHPAKDCDERTGKPLVVVIDNRPEAEQ